MSYSDSFARHFSRLVWLLLYEKDATDEQQAVLRSLTAVCADGPVTMAARDGQLVVNGMPQAAKLLGIGDLISQLSGHGVRELALDQALSSDMILGAARIVASEPTPGDGGMLFEVLLSTSDLAGVRAVSEVAAVDTPPAPSLPGARVSDKTVVPIVNTEHGAGYMAFAAVQRSPTSVPELFAKIDAADSPSSVGRYLGDLASIASTSAAGGARVVVADVLYGILKREPGVEFQDLRLIYTLTLRQLATPVVLKAIAELLPAMPDRHDELIAVLARAGENGVEAILEQLATAPTRAERRLYFDSVVKLHASVSVLCHMLGDSRWYVARNAADLLAEVGDPSTDVALIQALKHSEERVRASAAAALTRLGTPRALEALRVAVRDSSPRVRTPAVSGLAVRKEPRATGTLIRALGDESDAEVQIAIVSALGRLATPEAVEKLIEAAQPAGWLGPKKPAVYRAAAVQALADAHTPAAIAALNALANDREQDVRAAVARAIAQQSPPSPERRASR